MNFLMSKSDSFFFSLQVPQLIKELQETASSFRKPAPAIKLDRDSMADLDSLHGLFYGLYKPGVLGNRTQPSPLNRGIMPAEAALLSVPGQSRELSCQYQESVSRQNGAETEHAFSSGYRAAFWMTLCGICGPSAPISGGVRDEYRKHTRQQGARIPQGNL